VAKAHLVWSKAGRLLMASVWRTAGMLSRWTENLVAPDMLLVAASVGARALFKQRPRDNHPAINGSVKQWTAVARRPSAPSMEIQP